jgi:DNA-binding MarR family transcriptional regulator
VSATLLQVAHLLKRLQHAHHKAAHSGLAKLDVSLVQWDALRHLDDHPGASLHQLAELTFQSDQAFGTLAARLVDRGLIERVPGPGRAVRHRLTARGLQVRRAGEKIVDRVVEKSFGSFTPKQVEQLAALLAEGLDHASRT